ncbi:Calpain-14 [Manis javanica]|nr:Calpain-14 [Manis javanica]
MRTEHLLVPDIALRPGHPRCLPAGEGSNWCQAFLACILPFGKWVPMVIDDRLPVSQAGQLVFVSSTYKNVLWGALLEKAYANCGGPSILQVTCNHGLEYLVKLQNPWGKAE